MAILRTIATVGGSNEGHPTSAGWVSGAVLVAVSSLLVRIVVMSLAPLVVSWLMPVVREDLWP